jgi:hypothetical protein
MIGTALAASAGAQQASSRSTASTSSDVQQCPPGMVMSNSPLARPARGMANTTGATGRTDSGTGMTATFGATHPDTLAARVSSANNAATNPDNRFTGLNTTNGANGTGVTPSSGSAAAPIMCVPLNGTAAMQRSTTTSSGGDVEMSKPATTSPSDSSGPATGVPPKKE